MRKLLLIGLLLVPTVLLAQKPATDEDEDVSTKADVPHGFHFRFKDRPSFRYGDDFKLDVRTKWHFDFRQFYPEKTALDDDSVFLLQRARIGIKGKATKFFDYEVEREMRQTFSDTPERHPWRDVFVNFKPHTLVNFQVGKFKLPFGMEESGSEDRLDFVNKSHTTDFLAPGRERGAMLHGDITKRIAYEAGVFRFDGENTDIKGRPTSGRTYAARVSGEPLRYVKFLPKTIRHIYLGIAATRGKVYEGLSSVRGQTDANHTYFDHLNVNGYRQRIGTELAWSEGPFGIKGEYIHMSEQRRGQSVRGLDIPDKESRGWYLTGTWTVLGQMKSNGKEPKKNLFADKGFGAVELGARFDVLTFYGKPTGSIPSPSARAATILPNSDRAWTLGPTWYLNHFVKIQANAGREFITDPGRDFDGKSVFWTGIVRIQFAM